uniref:U11/U12 small nuclear ribonucleoprotein 35 kDa protein n=1 Tax=Neogobius melanostomus TaxID=47308 RepID=A0A8C6TUM2_9GOBI
MTDWNPIAKEYNPLKAGSIDGTDVEPHDRAVFRAMYARYKPNKGVQGDPLLTLFVARLNPLTTDEKIHEVFSKFGDIQRLRLVRDIVTGFSKGYAFIEYKEERSVLKAWRDGNKLVVDQHEVFVDMEQERTLKGWVPRRLGGGLGERKSPGSCGLAAETDLSVNLSISAVSAQRPIEALADGGIGIDRDRGQERDLIGIGAGTSTEEAGTDVRTETGIATEGRERGDDHESDSPNVFYFVSCTFSVI